ncbi:MAG: tRNA epoxyqueuosine(34) reductase QueG [Gammaproteobacteria bacterium]
MTSLTQDIKRWGAELGFQDIGISGVRLDQDEEHLKTWLANNYHGSMAYMEAHGNKRSRPDELMPGTLRVISVRLDYTDTSAVNAKQRLDETHKAFVSRYALGRDYHKVLRGRLKKLAKKIEHASAKLMTSAPPPTNTTDASSEKNTSLVQQRVFVDSAPVLEKALARDAGLGWIGKHTNLINHQGGSWFFLGELFTNLPLYIDTPATNHCGTCTTCIEVCPTQAIVAPYKVDARRCISYLTIENKGEIPIEFRKNMGNRIYGCDDCQLFCPWNKFARSDIPDDFKPRHNLDSASLVELFQWTDEDFDLNTQGSAIRRTGYTGWLRNIAVALGNAPTSKEVIQALQARKDDNNPIVREHVNWALEEHLGSGHNSGLP